MTPSPASKFKSAAIAVQRIFEKDKLANKHRKEIAKFFISQRDLTLQYLKKLEPLFEEKNPLVKTQAEIPGWDAVWNEIAKRSTEELQKIILNVERDGMEAGLSRSKKTISISGVNPAKGTFDLSNPRAVEFFRETGGDLKYIKGIQDTTRDGLQTLITNALDSGDSYGQIATDIKNSFDGMSRDRAKSIAIHEIGVSYESGNMQFAQGLKDAGIKMVKRWRDSGDDLVSEGCLENAADGQIPIDQPHSSGHMQPPRFPGRGGSGGCRCYEEYEQAEE